MNKYSALTLFSLLFLLSSCLSTKPSYYEKEGQMHVKVLSTYYGKYDLLIKGADPSTFRTIDHYYTADANHVYLFRGIIMNSIVALEQADPATFEVLEHGYSRDASHVWYYTQLIHDVDSKSFRVLQEDYGKTDSLLFYCSRPVYGVDPNTVVFHSKHYIGDKNDVYRLEPDYHGIKLIPLHVSDKESFSIVQKKDDEFYFWAKDKNYVYYLGYHENDSNIVRSTIADYQSFEVVNHDYARDNVQVYYHDSILNEADPATMKSIEYFDQEFAKDKYHVFYRGKIVEGADPKTFKVKGEGLGKDKYREYDLR